jgi:hypothetical protein
MNRPPHDRAYWDRITAFATTFTAVLALAVSAYTAYLQRKQTMSAVWPHVEAGWSWGHDHFEVALTNKGIGPAMLWSFGVNVNGAPVRSWASFLAAIAPDLHLEKRCFANEVLGTALAPGDRAIALTCTLDAGAQTELLRAIPQAEVTVCYCSVYDECWTASNQRGTESVRSCPHEEPRSFKEYEKGDALWKALVSEGEAFGGGASEGATRAPGKDGG